MPAYICVTCGVQYAPSAQPPAHCAICEDERQYVGWQGQRWTTLEQMAAEGYHNVLREEEPGLISIGTMPSFAIGQRALLVRTPGANLLWDCQSFIDTATITAVRELGGVHAIAISHPHFYGVNIEWSEAFGGAPVYIHKADEQWVMRPHPNVVLWEGETMTPLPGLTLIRLGGHFDGAQVLYWPGGAGGKGAVLCGDTIQVVQDRRWVSFMYSYPNLIPLPPSTVRRIAETMRNYRFDRLYGAWNGRVVVADGLAAVERSAERYIRWETDATGEG
jgi:glyoxylase-like metal-dependent hydrolase (beta-lactamase superfamily II)